MANVYELDLGDEILVRGFRFVLTGVSAYQNDPASVEFKQPVELLEENPYAAVEIFVVSQRDKDFYNGPIHGVWGSSPTLRAYCGITEVKFGTYYPGLITCERCRFAAGRS